MTILVFNSGRFTVATETWKVMEFQPRNGPKELCVEIQVDHEDPVRIDATMDEFIAMVAEGGKVVDLRKLQK